MEIGDIVYNIYGDRLYHVNYIVLDVEIDEIKSFERITIIETEYYNEYLTASITDSVSPSVYTDYAVNYEINKKAMRDIKIKKLLNVRNK